MFLPLIEKRRSIRKYLDKKVEKEKIDALVEAALRSPSSRGFNPWEFIVVTDPDLLEKLSKSKSHGATFLKNAPLGIVVIGDPGKADTWVEDTSIASIFIHVAAESLGLGSCWIQIRGRMHDDTKSAKEYICDLLSIPKDLEIESIIAIGYPNQKLPPHLKDELQYEKVHYEGYGKKE